MTLREPKEIYLDPTQPIEQRVQDLLGRLTLEEKIGQMLNASPAIPRLGIPAYDYWSEALHGVARNGRATVFPQAIGMAASWDPDLIERVASAIADEGRAKYHAALRRTGETLRYQGLTFWSPNVNVFRDPRWGRGQETWGEDPYLTGEMGSAFVQGMQGDDPRYLKTAACAKHYAVHSGPERLRHGFDARASLRDMQDTYLPAFKKLVVDAKVEAVMGAYNRVNGAPACASDFLLEQTLRQEWGFEGHVVSDCGALGDIHNHHKVTADAAESSALALKAGCDLSCWCTYDHLGEAIERGLISEADIDRSLARTYTTRFKLGMFDPDEMVPFANTPLSVVNSPEHRALAHEAAVKSVVLLKNRKNILPIQPDVREVLVVGPNAGSVDALIGNYSGISDTFTTLLEGIAGRAPEGVKIEYRQGCQLTHPNANEHDWGVLQAAQADVVIACMGLNHLMEGEEGDALLTAENGDKSDIALPDAQVSYIRKLAAGGAKIVLVLFGGSPIALGEVAEMVEAVVFVWYPGQEGGRAVAEVLFGDHAPSGKLPLTFPESLDQVPPFEDYNMQGRTYRYSEAEPLYPFGFGLSYTRFEYSDLELQSNSLTAGEPVRFSFVVKNSGGVEAEEVAQVYLKDLETSVPAPLHKLFAFRRVQLKPGESQRLEFTVQAEQMMLVDEDGKSVLEPGRFRLTAGGCSPSARGEALGAPAPVSAEFTVQ